jgi:hypothetical protein
MMVLFVVVWFITIIPRIIFVSVIVLMRSHEIRTVINGLGMGINEGVKAFKQGENYKAQKQKINKSQRR